MCLKSDKREQFSRRKWRNCKGSSGSEFVDKFAELFELASSENDNSKYALAEVTVISQLILQGPLKGKISVCRKFLTRRIKWWNDGRLDDLLAEAKYLQQTHRQHMAKHRTFHPSNKVDWRKEFINMFYRGDAIQKELIPKILGKVSSSSEEEVIYGLLLRDGGLGIRDPTIDTALEYSRSLRICQPFLTGRSAEECFEEEHSIFKSFRDEESIKVNEKLSTLQDKLSLEVRVAF
ncbi:hypothetical protein GJ496_006727 [Pomphorhynchus laevis]|nr:hypothetical protein GJ496_006727 [Pomphorhynchus laevis]